MGKGLGQRVLVLPDGVEGTEVRGEEVSEAESTVCVCGGVAGCVGCLAISRGAGGRLASVGQCRAAEDGRLLLHTLPPPCHCPRSRPSTETPAEVGKVTKMTPPFPSAVLGSLGQDLLCSFMHQF